LFVLLGACAPFATAVGVPMLSPNVGPQAAGSPRATVRTIPLAGCRSIEPAGSPPDVEVSECESRKGGGSPNGRVSPGRRMV
jgi:hypothetical protein